MDDKKYWSEYYSNNQKPTDASSFAVFVQEKLEKGKTLDELTIEFIDKDEKSIVLDRIKLF